jgi:hypothetical protein
MALHNGLHVGSAAHAVLSAQDARLALAGLLALNGPGPLDVRPGIMYAPGNPGLVTGDTSTGPWRYTVAAGSFVTTKGNLDGPHLSTNDGNVLVSTIAPPGSNSRYDLIYAMQQDADATISPDGSTAPLLGVVNGTAAASPAVPALPAGAIALATALIASTAVGGTSGAGVTIDTTVSRFTTTRNDPIPVRNATERNAITAYDSLAVYRLDTHLVETYNSGLAMFLGAPPVARAIKGGAQNLSASPGTNVAVIFDAGAPIDTSVMWGAGFQSRLTATVAGYYQITGKAGLTPTTPTWTAVVIAKNGALLPETTVSIPATPITPRLMTSTLVQLAVGDYVELMVSCSLASAAISIPECFMQAVWVRP